MIVLAIVGLWSAIAVGGMAVSGWALIDGYIDRRAQRVSGVDGAHSLIVRINLRGAEASLLLHTFFLLLGIRALTNLPSLSLGFVVLAFGYMVVAATNVRAVGLNQFDRWRLREGKLPA